MPRYPVGDSSGTPEPETNEVDPGDVELKSLVPTPTPEQQQDWGDIQALVADVQPILRKIGDAAVAYTKNHGASIRIKPADCKTLMDWIVTLQNIGDLQATQLKACSAAVVSLQATVTQYEEQTGKKLWSPGPIRV